MMVLRRLWRSTGAAAAAEMALVTPLLVLILFGSVELGNYFMDEHILLKGVRNGARFAARQAFSQYNGCSSTVANVPSSLRDDTKLLVRKGTLSNSSTDLLPNWTAGTAIFTVTMTCSTTAGSTTLGGIYGGNSVGTSGVAPAVLVTAKLPYRPIVASSVLGSTVFLNAAQQAAVTGI